MWRVTGFLRLVGLVLYALALATVWACWGVLILCGALLVAGFRLVGVSLADLERLVATHAHGWSSALRVMPRARARARDDHGRQER